MVENKSLNNVNIAFIGCGAMAQALIDGILKSEVEASQLFAADIASNAKTFCEKKGIKFFSSAKDMLKNEKADIIIVCVKPDQLNSILKDVNGRQQRKCILISICAGVTIDTIRKGVTSSKNSDNQKDEDIHIVRVMPNVNCMVQAAAMGYVMEQENEADAKIVESLFGTCGLILQLSSEKLMHGVTGLSGSGPAFVYQFIEALADGGVRSGLPRNIALQLAAQTVLGSAKMVLESGKHPGELKDMVTSPSGTTIAGVHALESGRMRATVMDAVYNASNRSVELSKL